MINELIKELIRRVFLPLPLGEGGRGVRLLLFLLLFSCTENRDLQTRASTGHVVISPQWAAGIQPQSLRYCFYPASGQAVNVDGTAAGCEGDLPAGAYRMLAYNAGATGVRFTGMDEYATGTVELVPVATRGGGYALVNEPSEVYAAALSEGLTVAAGGQTEGGAAVRKVMHILVFNFTIGSGLSLDKLEGTLCGVYPSVLLSTGEPTQTALREAPETAVRFGADLRSATEATATVRVPGLLDPQNGTAYDNLLNMQLDTTEGEHYTSAVNLNGALTQILADHGGTLPVEVPVEMDIRVERTAVGLSATVQGWQAGETSEGTIH